MGISAASADGNDASIAREAAPAPRNTARLEAVASPADSCWEQVISAAQRDRLHGADVWEMEDPKKHAADEGTSTADECRERAMAWREEAEWRLITCTKLGCYDPVADQRQEAQNCNSGKGRNRFTLGAQSESLFQIIAFLTRKLKQIG